VTEAVLVVIGLLASGITAWEWRTFWVLDPRATRTGLPVCRQELDAAAWALLRAGNPFGYRTRATGAAEVLVRPVSRFEPGPSAAPFLFALAKVTASKGTAQLIGYLPTGPLTLTALIAFAPVASGVGGAIWGLLILVVAAFGLLVELNEVKLCFGRLQKLAHAEPPMRLSGSEQPDNNEMQLTRSADRPAERGPRS
jgi:hypothetical protein